MSIASLAVLPWVPPVGVQIADAPERTAEAIRRLGTDQPSRRALSVFGSSRGLGKLFEEVL
jgi:hypothetical protein